MNGTLYGCVQTSDAIAVCENLQTGDNKGDCGRAEAFGVISGKVRFRIVSKTRNNCNHIADDSVLL